MSIKPIYITPEAVPSVSTDSFLFINVPLDSPKPFSVFGLHLYMNTEFPDTLEEAQSNCCTLIDIDTYLKFLQCLKDYKKLYIVEDKNTGQCLSFALGLVLYLIQGEKIADAMYKQVCELPTAAPEALWTVMCIDHALNLKTALIEAYNDYYATKIVVDSGGNICEGRF